MTFTHNPKLRSCCVFRKIQHCFCGCGSHVQFLADENIHRYSSQKPVLCKLHTPKSVSWKPTTVHKSIFHSQIYTLLPSLWMFLDGATEPFVTGVMISLSDNQLFSFLATVEAPYPTKRRAVCRSFLPTNCR